MRSKNAPGNPHPRQFLPTPTPASGRGAEDEAKVSSPVLNPSPGTGERSARALRVASAAPGVGASSLERRIIASLILFTILVSCLPYALGYFLAPVMGEKGGPSFFIGTAYNIDDYCNYLSWLRQMADGHFFIHNLFTTDPQKNIEFNVFFWLLGRLMAVTHCSPQAALQVARMGGGVGLLWLLARFYRHCLPANVPARLTAFGFACVSSGFGWVVWNHWKNKNLPGGPVDAWQPEAYTFLSIYTSALMTVSTVLILGALYALLLGEQTGRWKYPLIAGLCGAILGNMHSYDVLHLSAAWGLFLIVLTIIKRGKGMAQSWLRAVVALALTLPTTLYIFYMYRTEAVFQKRANVPTLSPALWHYALGYGLVFLLALLAGWVVVRKMEAPTPAASSDPSPASRERGKTKEGSLSVLNPSPGTGEGSLLAAGVGAIPLPLLFALCWAVAGLVVIYLPFAFQRKMLMGEQIPLCLLAGVGAAWLAQKLTPHVRPLALAALVLASAPSNALFLVRDFRHLEYNRSETHLTPFLSTSLVDVYGWLRTNTPENAAIVGFPGLCTYIPGEAGRAVWAGHWAETPSYGKKDAEFADAFDSLSSNTDRHAFLESTHAQYLFYPNDISKATFKRHGETHTFVELTAAPPPYLTQVYKNDTFTVYQIH
jgi:hypothetical protein